MASISIPNGYDVISHTVHPLQYNIPPTHSRRYPPRLIQFLLTIKVGYTTPSTTSNPFFSQQFLSLSLNHLQDHDVFRQLLAPILASLGINTSSPHYETILRQITECGLNLAGVYAYRCKLLHLQSVILVGRAVINRESSLTRALAISASEFERINNYGMVAAKESFVKEMIKRVTVEEGEKQNCTVCLEELEVGFEASQMPCSHMFHGNCIETWLRQSHYCPICRYEMPTN